MLSSYSYGFGEFLHPWIIYSISWINSMNYQIITRKEQQVRDWALDTLVRGLRFNTETI